MDSSDLLSCSLTSPLPCAVSGCGRGLMQLHLWWSGEKWQIRGKGAFWVCCLHDASCVGCLMDGLSMPNSVLQNPILTEFASPHCCFKKRMEHFLLESCVLSTHLCAYVAWPWNTRTRWEDVLDTCQVCGAHARQNASNCCQQMSCKGVQQMSCKGVQGLWGSCPS